MDNERHAKDEECISCGEQAVVFFPVFDPDIQSDPYCRKCVEKAKIELLIQLNNEKI